MIYLRTLLATFVAAIFLVGPSAAQSDDAPDWQSFEEAVTSAEDSGKKVLVFIYAPWCGYCQQMINDVYPREAVQSAMNEHYEFARLNGTITEDTISYKGHSLSSQELAVGLGMRAYPTHVFLSPDGDYIAHQPGYFEAEKFITLLDYLGDDAYKNQSFSEFSANGQ